METLNKGESVAILCVLKYIDCNTCPMRNKNADMGDCLDDTLGGLKKLRKNAEIEKISKGNRDRDSWFYDCINSD